MILYVEPTIHVMLGRGSKMKEPMDLAWQLLKSEVLLWPKRFDNKHWMMEKPGPGGYTLQDKKGKSKAFVSLPNLGGDYGKDVHSMTDEELQNAFMETDAHETMHETLGNIGEGYDKPLHNEYPAMVAEYLQYARRPREQIPSNDMVSQLLNEGMDDREIAMQIAQRMAPLHQQVSPGKTMAGIAHYVTGPPNESYDDIQTGEPMGIAFQLLKERVSPEAKRHKIEYDKEYESTPERIKYRVALNRERRKRGMYGDHSHIDISHTQGNKLTVEDEHSNRARHFREKGTLRDDNE